MRTIQTAFAFSELLELAHRLREWLTVVFQTVATTYMIEQIYVFATQN